MGETKRHTFFGFQTEVDEAATRRWYAQAEPWGCRCGPCRNFLALARERGCYNVTLNVWACNQTAMDFYRRCGLQVQKTGMEVIL